MRAAARHNCGVSLINLDGEAGRQPRDVLLATLSSDASVWPPKGAQRQTFCQTRSDQQQAPGGDWGWGRGARKGAPGCGLKPSGQGGWNLP